MFLESLYNPLVLALILLWSGFVQAIILQKNNWSDEISIKYLVWEFGRTSSVQTFWQTYAGPDIYSAMSRIIPALHINK